VGKKLRVAAREPRPTGRPSRVAPMACAASSTIGMLRVDALHVGHLAEEVHGEDGARLRRERGLEPRGVEVERRGLDVDEDGAGAESGDRRDRGDERVRRGDDLVARADAEGHQRREDGVGAGGDGDAVCEAGVARDLSLEGGPFGAQDEVLGGEDALDGGADLGLDFAELGVEVQRGDRGGRHGGRVARVGWG